MSVRYHEVAPSNDNAAGFVEFNTIDFELLAEGRKMLKNTITVCADIVVNSSGSTPMDANKRIYIDNKIGFHSVFSSWSCEAKGSMLENIQDYPRYVSMVSSATMDKNDVFSVKNQAEGRQVVQAAGSIVIQAVACKNTTATNAIQTEPANFSILPSICFNNVVGDDYSFNKNGSIRISCNLARNIACLYGPASTSAQKPNYTLSNVRVKFNSIPDDGKQGAIMMNSVVGIKSVINSQQANISSRVPAAAVSGVVISFVKQAHENEYEKNSYALEKFNNIDEVQYLFSDSTNNYITYVIDDRGDMIAKGLNALSDSGHSNVDASKLAANQGFMIGLGFEDMLDLRNQKFTVQLKTSDALIGANPKTAFLYFLNLLTL